MKFVLFIFLFPMIVIAQVNSVIITKKDTIINTISEKAIFPNYEGKNTSYYLEEIKVRWKKAALENNNSNLFIGNGR